MLGERQDNTHHTDAGSIGNLAEAARVRSSTLFLPLALLIATTASPDDAFWHHTFPIDDRLSQGSGADPVEVSSTKRRPISVLVIPNLVRHRYMAICLGITTSWLLNRDFRSLTATEK